VGESPATALHVLHFEGVPAVGGYGNGVDHVSCAGIRGPLRGGSILLLLLLECLLLLHWLWRWTLRLEGVAAAVGQRTLLQVRRREEHCSRTGATSQFQIVLLWWWWIVGRVLLVVLLLVVRLCLQVHQVRIVHEVRRAAVLVHVRRRRMVLDQEIWQRLSQVVMMMRVVRR